MTKTLFVVVAVLTLSSLSLLAQSAPSIQGVWRIEEATLAGGTTIKNHPPEIYIFTARHCSNIGVRMPNGEPRPQYEPAKVPGKLTDAEKIARYEQWAPFGAFAGTYEVKGNTLTLVPIVAKSENAMSGKPTPGRLEFKVEGNTLAHIYPCRWEKSVGIQAIEVGIGNQDNLH